MRTLIAAYLSIYLYQWSFSIILLGVLVLAAIYEDYLTIKNKRAV